MYGTLIRLFSDVDVTPLPHPPADAAEMQKILAIVFSIAGAVALLVIVIGGFRYVISNGDPNSTAQAKNTIIYGIVGLIVVILAASIVGLVLGITK